jgi:hypothetical protein
MPSSTRATQVGVAVGAGLDALAVGAGADGDRGGACPEAPAPPQAETTSNATTTTQPVRTRFKETHPTRRQLTNAVAAGILCRGGAV